MTSNARTPETTPGQTGPAERSHWLVEWTRSLLVALLIWFLISTFVVKAFRIPSESMENTLLVGDFLFVTKALYGAEVPLIHRRLPAIREPRRGDVVVFDSKEEAGVEIVKRLIGVPGDTLAMVSGRMIRDGHPVDEPWAVISNAQKSEQPEVRARMRAWQLPHLAGGNPATYDPDIHDWGPIVVPPDSFFMMGDNRDNSYDSRYWGFLPRLSMRGSPLIVYFSYDPQSWHALPFLTAIRWGRFFTRPS